MFEKENSSHVARVLRKKGAWSGRAAWEGSYIFFLKLRKEEEILSREYRHLLSCERNSQGAKEQAPCSDRRSTLRSWRYYLDEFLTLFSML